MTKCWVIMICCLLPATAWADERFTFVVPGDDATATATDMSGLSQRPCSA